MRLKTIACQIPQQILVIVATDVAITYNGFDLITAWNRSCYASAHSFFQNNSLFTSICGTIIALFLLFYIIRPHILLYPYFTKVKDTDNKVRYQFLAINYGLWPVINLHITSREITDINRMKVHGIDELNCKHIPTLSGILDYKQNNEVAFGFIETEKMQKGEIQQVEIEILATHPISNVTWASSRIFNLSYVINNAYYENGTLKRCRWYHTFGIYFLRLFILVKYSLFITTTLLVIQLMYPCFDYALLNKIFIFGFVAWAVMHIAVQICQVCREDQS